MLDSILRTKLFAPPLRPSRVPRLRLLETLSQGLTHGHGLFLVSAPAGFGKSTLVGEWTSSLQLEGDDLARNSQRPFEAVNHVAWISLDAGDNDVGQFLRYVVTAVSQALHGRDSTVGKTALALLQSPQVPPAAAVLTPLLNGLAAIPENVLLVLDDYHRIEAQPVHDALGFLLENGPPSLHIVVATREDPPLPLARLRARARMTELRAADLRFTVEEAADFLNRIMGLGLSAADIAALETRTEGWITGLQLAALSLRASGDSARFIQSLTGSHRYVLDYLVEEVLERQPEDVQAFLLQTAVLNRLTASLCDHLTGQEQSQGTLEMLEHANLFIIPLDDERRWYRYHHLFDELLQQRLRRAFPALVNELHAKARRWYEANGDLSEAVHHAFAGNDLATAVRLIEKGAVDALERSDFSFIFDAVGRLPQGTLDHSPWLFVYYATALLLAGQIEAAAAKLDNTDWLLESVVQEDESRRREMLGFVASLEALLAGWRRDYQRMRISAQQAFANLPGNHWLCAYVYMFLGTGFWGDGNLTAAQSVFSKAAAIGNLAGNKRVAVTSAIYLGHTLELKGHLHQASEHYRDSFQLAEQDGVQLPLAAYLHIDIARVLCELNELEQASQHLAEGIQLSQILADSRIEKLGYCFLTRLNIARGDIAGASVSVRRAEQAHSGAAPSVDMRGGEYPHVRLWLAQGKLKQVAQWLSGNNADIGGVTHFKTKLTHTMHARALIALSREDSNRQRLGEALRLLDELLALAERNKWQAKVVEVLVLQAVALEARGDRAAARTKLAKALHLAQPEGYIRTFVDEGRPMARLLQEALKSGIAPAYVLRLLAASSQNEATPAEKAIFQVDQSHLIEPLSEREIEILHEIAEGLTNREIGARLHLSPNTVKVHTRNIYGKLGVHNRTQAVARARSLAILPAD